VPGRDALDAVLDEILDHPQRRDELEARIDEDFTAERAVLVLDMSGFSRTTQARGIVEFLLMIRQLRLIAEPLVWKHRGTIVKSEADNLFCLFGAVADALAAGREIIAGLNAANLALPEGRELYVSIGIGYGRVLLIGEEDLMGNEVNLASKLGEDVAGYGEILLTEAARDELGEDEAVEERTVSVSGLELRHYLVS
jgi:adenylate cyclase